MKKRPLPTPQHEFGFVPDTFTLFSESTLDGQRIRREQAEAEEARRLAEDLQEYLLAKEVERLEEKMMAAS